MCFDSLSGATHWQVNDCIRVFVNVLILKVDFPTCKINRTQKWFEHSASWKPRSCQWQCRESYHMSYQFNANYINVYTPFHIPLPVLSSDTERKFNISLAWKKAFLMICRMLSTMKSIVFIALAAMLTITNTEAHPTPDRLVCSPESGCT